MNRYSLFFAILVASSFAVHPPQAGNTGSSVGDSSSHSIGKRARSSPPGKGSYAKKGTRKPVEAVAPPPPIDEPVQVIQDFVNKGGGPTPNRELQVLFATVPHPVETHLALAFDDNLDALQDGLDETGYLFDSSWIPWNIHEDREYFDDDQKERIAKGQEDRLPGILLFRKKGLLGDSFAKGILVFLLSEKPTEGIELPQAVSALRVLSRVGIPLPDPIRIIGPTYSGSFASMVPVIKALHNANLSAEVRIRSGGVTGGSEATNAVSGLANQLPKTSISFGSAHHDYADWIRLAVATLEQIGIARSRCVILGEGESLYGGIYRQKEYNDELDLSGMWSLAFPRDISSLRVGYEKQGIFDTSTPTQPWKRFLNLKSDEGNEGDTIRTFGGTATTAAQESILFGISDFLKSHGIRAVIISATNEEDRLFLTQFLHIHNGSVRVVIIGNTRVFLRGSTAQFRGDIAVDDFPMLPRLHDWTRGSQYPGGKALDTSAHIFEDDVAQGTYFATIDLFAEPNCSSAKPGSPCPASEIKSFKWYPEYSEPSWDQARPPVQQPPMYVVALGGNSTWPVAESKGSPWLVPREPNSWQVEMPFTLLGYHQTSRSELPPVANPVLVGNTWKILFVSIVAVTLLYCACFWYANPISRALFASFEPSAEWRFWLFRVAIPAFVVGCTFRMLAWATEMPNVVSERAIVWGYTAEAMTILGAAGVPASAVVKALMLGGLKRNIWMLFSFLPTALAVIAFSFTGYFSLRPFEHLDTGSILNTYREMHWESGLSLIPTGMLFLLAILVWAAQAGNGAALLYTAPPLPHFPENARISRKRAKLICSIGRPLPDPRISIWFWIAWAAVAIPIGVAHFKYGQFTEITTLESFATTRLALACSGTIVILMLLDLLQFLWLWDELKGLLQALDRQELRRSFVPIEDFRWRNLWSSSGVSFRDRRAVDAAQVDCILELARKHDRSEFTTWASELEMIRNRYNSVPLPQINSVEFADDRAQFFRLILCAGSEAAKLVSMERFNRPGTAVSPDAEALRRALMTNRSGDGGRFDEEAEALARLPEWQQTAERLLCLICIGFIQTVVARLHTLLMSVASMFSLVTLGIAIYPFVPFSPLLISGILLLLVIGWAFFKVISEMDRDPILARIVNGDDKKLQGSFYMRFAESIGLPLLTLGSALLPGGAGRLLELAQAILNHTQ